MAFRRTLYESVEQLQTDLDKYLDFYNRQRTHQGYRTKRRTLYQAFLDGVKACFRNESPELESTDRIELRCPEIFS